MSSSYPFSMEGSHSVSPISLASVHRGHHERHGTCLHCLLVAISHGSISTFMAAVLRLLSHALEMSLSAPSWINIQHWSEYKLHPTLAAS